MPLPLIALAAPLIGAAASIGGSAFTNKANAREAQRNRDFQERMSNTAMRRQRDDMISAGINPAQAANAGGASTPGGAVASVENPLSGGISNARETKLAMENIKLMQSQREKLDVEKSKTAVEGATAVTQQKIVEEQLKQAAQLTRFQPGMLTGQTQALTIGNALNALLMPGASNQAKLDKRLGEAGPAIQLILNSAKGVKGLLK